MKSDDMDNMDVYKELPTSSYYNLSCVLSDLDSNYITPITKLNKFENPSFIKGVLNNKIGSNETSINKAIEYKCLSSWGIVDPRAINYNGTQKNIHKAVAFINDDKSKVYYNKKFYGKIYAIKKSFFHLLKNFFKSIFFLLILNYDKYIIFYLRFSGTYNSLIGKKSWYRPKIN